MFDITKIEFPAALRLARIVQVKKAQATIGACGFKRRKYFHLCMIQDKNHLVNCVVKLRIPSNEAHHLFKVMHIHDSSKERHDQVDAVGAKEFGLL